MQVYVNELMLLVFTIKHWKYFHNSKNTRMHLGLYGQFSIIIKIQRMHLGLNGQIKSEI